MKNAFNAALGLPYGIAVLAGTGSFAIGRSREGNSAKAGGWAQYSVMKEAVIISECAVCHVLQRYAIGADPGLFWIGKRCAF